MPPRPKKRSPSKPKPLFTPSQRRDELRLLLRTGWQTLSAVTERLDVSRTTAWRRLRELGETDPLESYEDGGHTYWRLPAAKGDHPLHVTTAEMIALAFVKNALGFVAGTGIKEDLDTLLGRFTHVLKASDFAHWKNLDRKLFDVNEGVHNYAEKIDVVNDVLTALLYEHRLTFRLRDGRDVKIDPYSIVLYKKGLYLLGFSHSHGQVRSFGLDRVDDATRHPDETFPYPPEFDPAAHVMGPFGLIRGARERVVVWFDEKVRRYVTRRVWHATQSFRDCNGGLEMTLEPDGWEEMVSWVLGFGEKAEVLEPKALREKVAAEARGAAGRYA
jgi:predicted DNA-binding transcriptional regulator YafY